MTSTITSGLGDGYEAGNPRAAPLTLEGHREWCRRRALYLLNEGNIGCIGNAVGGLIADLSRHPDTKDLAEKARALPGTYEAVYSFVEYL